MKTLYLSDSYVVVSKTKINDDERKVLTALYQPLIGSCALSLYFSLWLDFEENHHALTEFTHHRIVSLTLMNIGDIRDARGKLEAMGLLKTYLYEHNETRSYTYEIYAPLSAQEFLYHPILKASLFAALGKEQYEYTKGMFKTNNYSTKNYKNVSKTFNDVFQIITTDDDDYEEYDEYLSKHKNEVELDQGFFDEEIFRAELIKIGGAGISVTAKLVNTVKSLSFVYHATESDLARFVIQSIDANQRVNHGTLKKLVRSDFTYNEGGRTPKFVTKGQMKEVKSNSESKIVKYFTTITPQEFLRQKQNGNDPVSSELRLVEDLMTRQGLKPDVVNVLIDYVLRKNNNRLGRSFTESVAATWIRNGIDTCEKAIDFTLAEQKETKKKSKGNLRYDAKPESFEKDKVATPLTEEEKKEMELLKKTFIK
jgi:replication initiation and membrane attachment protein